MTLTRRNIVVRGTVQGVGFRPFVSSLASGLELAGFVRNDRDGVHIEVEGPRAAIERFTAALAADCPAPARIDDVVAQDEAARGEREFRIERSDDASARAGVSVPPDLATCDACLEELLGPGDRRRGHAFISCPRCGPRLTILRRRPYDRANTTMAGFRPCEACRREYDDPRSRRHHAQANACLACGPRLSLRDADGRPVASDDPVADAARAIRRGSIVAIKGLGGFHLACDATSEATVQRLRALKHRAEKPLAIMGRDLAALEELAELSDAERALVLSPARPIVLLRRRPGTSLAPAIAPGGALLGAMLPYTPVHHLLLRALGSPIVLTSGNRSEEPIAFEDADAIARLSGIADGHLVHDRPIEMRCDDSVARVVAGAPVVLRRARGYVPLPLPLGTPAARPVLAVGGHLKATFALGAGDRAFPSHHLGDLDDARAHAAYVAAIDHYERLLGIAPALLVHDRHPDYASTAYARERAARDGLATLAVQHHHAHFASCLAENGRRGPAIGVAFDGTGYGDDGTLWGGEFLVGDLRSARRAAHLRSVPLPGGERAIREPWRMALAHLVDAGLADRALPRVPAPDARATRTVRSMIESGSHAPPTSSVGRLFDAVAALLTGRGRASFEGQAAIELEALASGAAPGDTYPFEVDASRDPLVLDARPIVASVVDDLERGAPRERIARRFHGSLARAVADVCARIRAATKLEDVALTGGVFQNALLVTETRERLVAAGFRVHVHRSVPPNDGGLAYGQLVVAAARDGDPGGGERPSCA